MKKKKKKGDCLINFLVHFSVFASVELCLQTKAPNIFFFKVSIFLFFFFFLTSQILVGRILRIALLGCGPFIVLSSAHFRNQ